MSSPTAPVAHSEISPRWFVRFGALGVISQSSSKLYAQPLVGLAGAGPEVLLAGRGATYANILSASVQVGYFVTTNWSLEISGAVPVWQTVKITGFSLTPPVAGTVLTSALPAAAPITAVYHFTEFGALQPYLGGGVAPLFAIAEHDGFNTGARIEPSLGVVLQGGLDFMVNRNWGIYLDVKKIFDQLTGHATGINLGPPVGVIPAGASIRTNFQPWVLGAGLTYRF